MGPRSSKFATGDDARIAHLIHAIGPSAHVERSGRATFVLPQGIEPASVEALGTAIDHVHSSLESWLAESRIIVRNPRPQLILGLFEDQPAYDDYLDSEGLRGLAGSLGMTHPVRSLCCALVPGDQRRSADARVVLAHESVHLWALRSGFCPAWHLWPRWLHEGFAQLWDHLAASESQSQSENTARANQPLKPNEERQRDWRRIAATTVLDHFLRRDMHTDRRDHGADYATSWAIVYALATSLGGGNRLAGLVHHLLVRSLEPFMGISAESVALDWLKSDRMGSWDSFIGELAQLGRPPAGRTRANVRR